MYRSLINGVNPPVIDLVCSWLSRVKLKPLFVALFKPDGIGVVVKASTGVSVNFNENKEFPTKRFEKVEPADSVVYEDLN